ncbi:Rz1-like lysis system protein LysC [Aeromonas molluscorum]|uniref:Rz1-like lysis system protein LysC n=1 Tax=Aeromonas molluscorum TaxID=271417 RepID=UPI003F1A3C86
MQTQVVKRLPPPGLVPHCPEPDFNGDHLRRGRAVYPHLQTALRRCQTQLDTLDDWITQEETTP